MPLKTSKNAIVHVPTVEESQVRALALVADLKKKGWDLPVKVFDNLTVAGFQQPEDQAAIISMAIVAGMEPAHLVYTENIRAIAKAWKWTSEAGATPGDHYYLMPFKDGDTKTVYSPVPAVKWLRISVEKHGFSQVGRVMYNYEWKPLMGAKLQEYLDYYIPDHVANAQNRGALARFVPYINGKPTLTDPDANWSFGYYLHTGIKKKNRKGEEYVTGSDAAKMTAGAASNTPARRAQTRAERLACYAITRTLHSVNAATIEENLAAVIDMARQRVRSGDFSIPEDEGFVDSDVDVDIDEAIEGEYSDVPETRDEPPVVVTTAAPETRPEPVAKVKTVVPDEDKEEEKEEKKAYEPVGWEDTRLQIYERCSKATQDTIDAIPEAAGKVVDRAAMTRLRGWIEQAAGSEDGSLNGGGVKMTDLVILALFGVEPGQFIYLNQAGAFWPFVATKQGDGNKATWEYQAASEGALALRELVLRAQDIYAHAF